MGPCPWVVLDLSLCVPALRVQSIVALLHHVRPVWQCGLPPCSCEVLDHPLARYQVIGDRIPYQQLDVVVHNDLR